MTFTPCRTPAPCIRTRADGSLCQVLNETGFDGVWMRGRPALSHDAEPSRPQPNSRRLDLWCVSSERATCERVRAPAGLHLVLLNLRCGFKPLQLQAFSSCNNTYRSQNNYKQLQRLHMRLHIGRTFSAKQRIKQTVLFSLSFQRNEQGLKPQRRG